MMIKKRQMWLILGVLALTAVAYFGWQAQQPDTVTAQEGGGETAVAFLGDLSAYATATGKIEAQQKATLTAQSIARVERVHVRVGDTVAAGTPLVQLDTTTLALDIARAEQSLRQAEAALTHLTTPPVLEDVAAAEARVTSAQATLDHLLAGPSATTVAELEASIAAANASVWASSVRVDQVQTSVTDAQRLSAEASLLSAELQLDQARETNGATPNEATHNALMAATQAYDRALATYNEVLAGPNQGELGGVQNDLAAAVARQERSEETRNNTLSGPTTAQIASTQAQLAQAENALATLIADPTAAQIAAAEAEIAQAQLTLDNARRALDEATLVAPFEGVVTAVFVQEGEIAMGAVIELISTQQTLVLHVDEVDIGQLAEGMPALVALETWPDDPIQSDIEVIAPRATNSGGGTLVSYDVHLNLGETPLPIRAGMTANATFTTAENRDVLLVPNRAIQADRVNEQYGVSVVGSDGATREVRVTIGLRDNAYTEITSGLTAGDVVVLAPVGGQEEEENSFFEGPPGR